MKWCSHFTFLGIVYVLSSWRLISNVYHILYNRRNRGLHHLLIFLQVSMHVLVILATLVKTFLAIQSRIEFSLYATITGTLTQLRLLLGRIRNLLLDCRTLRSGHTHQQQSLLRCRR